MKRVLVFVQAKEEHPELTKPQLCKMIGISDSSLKRIMKDLNMKSFYHHEAPVNRKKTDLTMKQSKLILMNTHSDNWKNWRFGILSSSVQI